MMHKLLEILKKWPKIYVSTSDLASTWPGSEDSLHAIIKRAVKKKDLIRLRKGFFLISLKLQSQKPDLFELSGVLYGPSYISLESALSYHGWITEGVYLTTNSTSKRSLEFSTPIGDFLYSHIPISIFSFGVNSIKNRTSQALIASPWKAIADLLYVQNKNWDNINQLATDLRIEMDYMQNSNLDLLKELTERYPSKKVKNNLRKLYKNLIL